MNRPAPDERQWHLWNGAVALQVGAYALVTCIGLRHFSSHTILAEKFSAVAWGAGLTTLVHASRVSELNLKQRQQQQQQQQQQAGTPSQTLEKPPE